MKLIQIGVVKFVFCKPLTECNFWLGSAHYEGRKSGFVSLLKFPLSVEKPHLGRSTDILTCVLKMGKQVQYYLNHRIVCQCGLYMYIPGGNHLRKCKHKLWYHLNSLTVSDTLTKIKQQH